MHARNHTPHINAHVIVILMWWCLDGAQIDVVVFWTVLIHVPTEEIHSMLLEAQRVLKPNGRIILADNDLAGWSCENGMQSLPKPLLVPSSAP